MTNPTEAGASDAGRPGAEGPGSRGGPGGRPGESILDTLARRAHRAPRVHLRDVGTQDAGPLIDPKAGALQDELSKADQGKYRILGEIARGGMGVVLRGHDLELGRDVALKVIDAELAQRPDVIERFVEEAQIGGQLQHPGIVPVYELGLMADQRPYFTMKLIKGRTLAEMLTRRESVEQDRVRFLGIFHSVCQTLAYAHSKGVIHRDLKPANIMIGAFGEVQVVDWGLSKVLHRGGVADERQARDTALSVIETIRSGPRSGSDSLVGNVLGTPAYMSPEQAQGEIDKLDERTDVFALGALLCEILTGAPPYVAPEGESAVQLAAMAELDDARSRIAASSAAEELKKLCLTCLLPARAARTRDAEKLATTVQEHLSGLEERVHEEQLRAERARRRLQATVLVGALLLLVVGGWWWTDREARERHAELALAFDELSAEVVDRERDGDFGGAIERATAGLLLVEAGDSDARLLERARVFLAGTKTRAAAQHERSAERERVLALLDELDELHMEFASGEKSFSSEELAELDQEYEQTFRALGIDLTDPRLSEVVDELRETPVGVRMALGLGDWGFVPLLLAMENSKDAGGLPRESRLRWGIAMDLDPDPMRAELRRAALEGDFEAVIAIASQGNLQSEEPETLGMLSGTLVLGNQLALAARITELGLARYPKDLALAVWAGIAAQATGNTTRAAAYLRVAVSLRPESVPLRERLANALARSGDLRGAVVARGVALELDPEDHSLYVNQGVDLLQLGQLEEAILCFDEGLRRTLEAAARGGAAPSYYLRELPRFVRAATGTADIEEFLEWVEEDPLEDPSKVTRASLLLTLFSPPGVETDPLRALSLLEPVLESEPRWTIYWLALGSAYVLAEDGPSAVHAGRTLQGLAEANRHARALGSLLEAAGHGLNGDHQAAAARLAETRALQRDLHGGNAADWHGGYLERLLRICEPAALGD